ncbi:hypothetical protein Alches_12420 [Alicyclobacillus hesperidum subsp. aegles]|nr:hypothetical protein Alches_12420 [Alicyclobacillus hesperidum subsp. aegles]
MTHLLPRLFFEHFQPTCFVTEDDGVLLAFLIGFVLQTHPTEAEHRARKRHRIFGLNVREGNQGEGAI